MLGKAQYSISKFLKETFSSESARIAALGEDVRLLNAAVAGHHDQVRSLESEIETLKMLTGKVLSNQIKQHGIYDNIQDAEFRVFSQFGDDGIIQYLVQQTRPEHEVFIEFGTQDYRESNTRFLLMNNNWKGLIIEGDAACVESVQREEIYWKYDLTAVNRFIDRDNINQIFLEHGFRGEIGLLSIDIDGNDYWIWECINTVDSDMVVVEYNSLFGPEYAITVPYNPRFYRTTAHYSNLYWGCSLRALSLLADRKGYAFLGTNSNGNNAHFVRRDRLGVLKPMSVRDGYRESKFRESRDKNGILTYLSGQDRLKAVQDMEVYDLDTNSLITIRDLFGL
jgi:hypothetical protein